MAMSPRRSNRSSSKPQRALEPMSYAEPDLDLENFEEDEDQLLVKQKKPSTPPSSASSSSNLNSGGSATRSRSSLRSKKPASAATGDKDKDIGESKPAHVRRLAPKTASAILPDSTGSSQHFIEGELSDADDGVTRCVCGLQPDDHDGIMIQCEDCTVWQHGICIGIPDLDRCPEKYYCEMCRPHMHPKGQGARYRPSLSSSNVPTPPTITKSKSPKKRNTANSRETEQTPTSAAMLSLSPEAIMKEYGISKPINSSGSASSVVTTNVSQPRTKPNSRKRSRQSGTLKPPKSSELAAQDSHVVDPLHIGAAVPRRNSTSKSNNQDANAGEASLPRMDSEILHGPSTLTRVGQPKTLDVRGIVDETESTKRARSPSPDASRANGGNEDTSVASNDKATEVLQTAQSGAKRRRTTRTNANQSDDQNGSLPMNYKDSKGVHSISHSSSEAGNLSQAMKDKEELDRKQASGSKRRRTGVNSAETLSASIPKTTPTGNTNTRNRSTKKSTGNTRGAATTSVPTTESNTILVPPTYITSTRRSGKQTAVTPNTSGGATSGATPPPSVSSHPYYEALGDLVKIRAKVRQTHSRMSLAEMNKRAKLMLDYITRIQMERAEILERQEKEDLREVARERRRQLKRKRSEKLASRKLKEKGKRKGQNDGAGTALLSNVDAGKVKENGDGNGYLDIYSLSNATTTTTTPPPPTATPAPKITSPPIISIDLKASLETLKDSELHSKGLDDIGLVKNGKSHLNGTKQTSSWDVEKSTDDSLEMMDNLTRDIIKFQKRFPIKGRGTKT